MMLVNVRTEGFASRSDQEQDDAGGRQEADRAVSMHGARVGFVESSTSRIRPAGERCKSPRSPNRRHAASAASGLDGRRRGSVVVFSASPVDARDA